MPKLYICFLRANSELLQKHVLNSAAALFAPSSGNGSPMVHAEIFFPVSDDKASVLGKSCGIHYGGQVFMAEKRFSKTTWEFRAITCSDQSYTKMLDYCRSQRGGDFNYMGYFTPCGISMQSRLHEKTPQRWYCSELCAAILHHGDIVDCDMNPECAAHPQTLYNTILPFTFADCGRNIAEACLQI